MVKITFQGETREKVEQEMRVWLGLSASADSMTETRIDMAVFGKQPLPEGAAVPLPPAGTVAAATPLPTAPAAPLVFSPVPPVPPPSAAATPLPTATPLPAGGEAVDGSGMPWDERIHSSSRALVADGTWRKKRGVDPAYHERIEAEVRSGLPVAFGTGVHHTAHALTAPAPPVPAAPAAPVSTGTTFPEAIRRIGPKLRDGTISQAHLAGVLAAHGGLTGLHELNNKPAAVLDAVLAALGA